MYGLVVRVQDRQALAPIIEASKYKKGWPPHSAFTRYATSRIDVGMHF